MLVDGGSDHHIYLTHSVERDPTIYQEVIQLGYGEGLNGMNFFGLGIEVTRIFFL